ncbi:MAG: hypothetical protein AAGC55_18230, partial [Myxococcota bacterium]
VTNDELAAHIGPAADFIELEIVDDLPRMSDGAIDRETLRTRATSRLSAAPDASINPRAQR